MVTALLIIKQYDWMFQVTRLVLTDQSPIGPQAPVLLVQGDW